MRYRRLGSSDLEVSESSLGSWLTFAGGVGFEQTRAAIDLGGPDLFVSSQPQYSMLWRAPEVELFRCVRPMASPRSSGHHWRRGC
jgi:aryl-alcohol dehydrogenase-like predicted oxidoreductase